MKTRKGTDPKVRPVQQHRDRTKYDRKARAFKRSREKFEGALRELADTEPMPRVPYSEDFSNQPCGKCGVPRYRCTC